MRSSEFEDEDENDLPIAWPFTAFFREAEFKEPDDRSAGFRISLHRSKISKDL